MLNNRAGFTLLELLVVLVIISLVAGIGVPRFTGSLERAEFRAEAGKVAATIRAVRMKAVSEKTHACAVIDGEKRTVYGVTGQVGPDSLTQKPATPVETFSENVALWENGTKVKRSTACFLPTGASTGAEYIVARAEASALETENGYSIGIEPLTGRVTVVRASERERKSR